MAGVHGDQTFGNEARFRHPRQFVALAKSPQMERCPRTGLGSTGKTCKFRKLKQALNTMASSFNIAGAGRIQFSNNRHVIAFPRREYARVLPYVVLPAKNQRAQGMPGARCARSLACKVKKHTSIVTTVTPDSPGIPRAMVLTVSFVLSPVIGLYCHRRQRSAS